MCLSFADALREQLPDFTERHVSASERTSPGDEFGLPPVRKLLRNGVDEELFSSDIGMPVSRLLWVLGAIVLEVARVNYANLATARAARRVREVGVRKAPDIGPIERTIRLGAG